MRKQKLTHNDARQKVCLWCGQKKKCVRKISAPIQSLIDSKGCFAARPEDDDRLPSGICDNCRKGLQKESSMNVLPPPFDYG